jgi:hypothetical protein
MEKESPDSWLLPHLKRQLRGLEAAKGRTPKEVFLNGVPYEPKSDERQLRRTFGQTTPMQPDERIHQAPQPFTTEELDAAGMPENFHPLAGWWSTLEDMRGDLGLPDPPADHS